MSLAFSALDLLVVLVILGSAGYAVYRGFVAESLGIVAWAAAAFAALYFGPSVARLAHELIATSWVATLTGYVIIFFGVFIPLQFASHRFSEGVRRSPVGPLDRALGGAFGVVRGLAILGIVYIVFTAMVPVRKQPDWVQGARTLPLVQSSAEVLLSLIPSNDYREERALAAPPPAPQAEPAPEKKPVAVKKKHVKKRYGAHDRRALDRLFEATGKDGSGDR